MLRFRRRLFHDWRAGRCAGRLFFRGAFDIRGGGIVVLERGRGEGVGRIGDGTRQKDDVSLYDVHAHCSRRRTKRELPSSLFVQRRRKSISIKDFPRKYVPKKEMSRKSTVSPQYIQLLPSDDEDCLSPPPPLSPPPVPRPASPRSDYVRGTTSYAQKHRRAASLSVTCDPSSPRRCKTPS